MAVIIPVVSKFDDKGLKQAQSEFGKLGKSMKGLLGAAGLAVGFSAIVDFAKNSAIAASEDAKSQALLANQLHNTIGATQEQVAAVETSISAMQRQAAVADDVIRPAMSALVRATGDVGDATKLTSLALDVSAGTGKDVQSVAIALGKAYQGNTSALQKMGINVKGMADPLGTLATQFDGAAEAAANTDPVNRLNIIFGELQEQIGLALLPQLNAFADWMADPVHAQEATNLAQTIGGAFAVILEEVSGLIEGLAVVGWAFDNLFKDPMEVFKVLGMTIGEGYDYIMKKQNAALKNGQKVNNVLLGGGLGGNYVPPPVVTPKVETPAEKKARLKAEAAAKARAKAMADAKKANDEAKQSYEELRKSIDLFNQSFADSAKAFQMVFKFSAPLGEFEQQAVDAFDTMRQAAQDAFDQGLIQKSALTSLKAYADREQALLQGIAKQRDQLAKKISIAQAVTNSVMGSLDINSMLESETKQVTRSVTSMVNGIALTTTQTFDEVVTSGLADSFKKLVDKTKTFAANLIKLKALGLNGQLFKQIVDAGATTGGATAEAIIAGGADAVKELNGLFGQLTEAGASIAETATPVMYALGEDMTNSFIDGLRSQDQVLIAQASAMAALFTSSFQTQLSSAIAPNLSNSLVTALGKDYAKYENYVTGAVSGYSGQALNDQIDMLTGANVSAPGSFMNSLGYMNSQGKVTINVNAGVVANKQELPAMIVDALNTAAKQGLSTRIINTK